MRLRLAIAGIVASGSLLARPVSAQMIEFERLPISDAALPTTLRSSVGPAMRLVSNVSVNHANGTRARLVVYTSPCECDSSEPTPTRVGLYIGKADAPAMLAHARAMLVRFEAGEHTVFIAASVRLEGGGYSLDVTSLSFGLVGAGRTSQRIQHSADSSWQFGSEGALQSVGVLAPVANDDPSLWVTVNTEAAGVVARLAADAGLTLWRADLVQQTITLAPTAQGWHVGPFATSEHARSAADHLVEALQRLPAGPPINMRIVSANAVRVRGPRPLLVAPDPSRLRSRLAPLLSIWRRSIVTGDAHLFASLFSPAHLHVNSVGTRSDVGRVLSGPEVFTEASQLFACLRNAREMAAELTIGLPVVGSVYSQSFPQTLGEMQFTETVRVGGLRCAPTAGITSYPLTLELAWTGTRWVILDAFVAG